MPTTLRRSLDGLVDARRAGHPLARLLLARDQAVMARHLYLAGAVRLGALAFLPGTRQELAHRLDVPDTDRLSGWLELGVACGELVRDGQRSRLRGRRARALAAGDVLTASW